MKNLTLIFVILLSGCMSMQETRQAKNLTSYELNVGYQEAYRLISSSLLQDCDLVTNAVQPVIYIDAGFARINHVLEGVVTWSMDLKDAGQGKTRMDFYTGFPVQLRYAKRIEQHVNNKIPGCYYDEIK